MSSPQVDKRDNEDREAGVAAEREDTSADEKSEKVDGDESDISPLLSLPRELLSHIFTFLSIEDRMRARVNKTLSDVEATSKYYLDTVFIEQSSTASISKPERKCPLECIDKIAERTIAKLLEITIPGSNIPEIKSSTEYSIFTRMSFSRITLKFAAPYLGREIMKDAALVNELSKKGDFLDFGPILTDEQIHQIYKNILDDSMSVRQLLGRRTEKTTRLAFLRRIGIIFYNRQVHWNRDIEVFKTSYCQTHDRFDVFAGRLQIIFDDDTRGYFDSSLRIINHLTEQSKREAIDLLQRDSSIRQA